MEVLLHKTDSFVMQITYVMYDTWVFLDVNVPIIAPIHVRFIDMGNNVRYRDRCSRSSGTQEILYVNYHIGVSYRRMAIRCLSLSDYSLREEHLENTQRAVKARCLESHRVVRSSYKRFRNAECTRDCALAWSEWTERRPSRRDALSARLNPEQRERY